MSVLRVPSRRRSPASCVEGVLVSYQVLASPELVAASYEHISLGNREGEDINGSVRHESNIVSNVIAVEMGSDYASVPGSSTW